MAYLQNLIPRLRYDRWDYVRALRAMLPRGVLWQIPLPDESDVRPYGIVSSEAFGRVTISAGDIIITPNGIISGEGFGLATIVPKWSISPNGIASEEVWGEPTIVGAFTQYSDFSGGLGTGWDSQFTTNWSAVTEDGEDIAQRATDGDDRLYPASGQLLSGDFLIEWGFWRSSSEPGNKSIHIALKNSGGSGIADCLYTGSISGIAGGSFAMSAGPSEQRMRLQRESGVIWAYRWTGVTWQREDSWSTPGSSISDSQDLYIVANGADGVNGLTYVGVNGTLV